MSGTSQPRPKAGKVTQIVLTGFMGAGKTTAGMLAAERLRWRFVDIDRMVEERAGMTVAAIFEQRGEEAFRALEAAAIREAAVHDQVVMALGGGAIERDETRAFLASLETCRVVYLEAPFDTLMARCAEQSGGAVRPVLRDRERLTARWQARLPLYQQADATVSTVDLAPEAVAEAVLAAAGVAAAESAPAGPQIRTGVNTEARA